MFILPVGFIREDYVNVNMLLSGGILCWLRTDLKDMLAVPFDALPMACKDCDLIPKPPPNRNAVFPFNAIRVVPA